MRTEALLDSDVIIWCLRGKKETVDFIQNLEASCWPACSVLSLLEVELGMKPGEESATHRLLDSLRMIPVSKAIARQAAQYILKYKSRGRMIDFVDAVIAATCLAEDLTLVTYNLKHYPMPEISKLAPSPIPV